jgi:predicted dithiol-disulfide oxidoreductase (DUF899 family)
MSLPPVVSPAEWQAARDELLAEEKAATRALDALAAKRRRLPMVRFDKPYVFDGPSGGASLVDLFEGRRQLIVYNFMLWPGEGRVCGGCASFTDNVANLAHLHARDTTFALVSRVPRSQIEAVRQRFGWTAPWYSSLDSDFNYDVGVSSERGEMFGLSVFLRDGDDVYRTYFTTARGVDRLRLDFNLLDLTPLGRQEAWEDSPDGWPQDPTMAWMRLRDEYEGATIS